MDAADFITVCAVLEGCTIREYLAYALIL